MTENKETRSQSPQPQGNGNDHYMQGYEEGVRDTKEFWIKRNRVDLAGLITAAEAVIARWDSPAWKDLPATAEFINRLRDQLKTIRAALSTDQYALGFEAGKKSRDNEVRELVDSAWNLYKMGWFNNSSCATREQNNAMKKMRSLIAKYTNNQGENE